jgi:hypothetical protein
VRWLAEDDAWPGWDALAGRVSGRCEAQPPDRSQYLGGGGGVSSGAADQRGRPGHGRQETVHRSGHAGLGTHVGGPRGGVGQFGREHVPGEAVTPGERQAMGRRAVQDFEASA